MNKRAFLEGFFTASTIVFGGHYMWLRVARQNVPAHLATSASQITTGDRTIGVVAPMSDQFSFTPIQIETSRGAVPLPAPAPTATLSDSFNISSMSNLEIGRYLTKIRNFDAIFANDIYLDPKYEKILLSTASHLVRVENHIGHGNFNLLSFDEMLRYARAFPRIGEFEAEELNFIEDIFFTDPSRYGFFGEKVTSKLTDILDKQAIAKIPRSGHYLLKGESLNLYNKIKSDVGGQIVLTSGVRSIVKQIHLFLAKAIESNGNLSRASRSLAPPGHSYHGIGDFDVGKIGLGEKNFTAEFSNTQEYRKIAGLAYVDIRYPTDNLFGVRFEPWHIKLG